MTIIRRGNERICSAGSAVLPELRLQSIGASPFRNWPIISFSAVFLFSNHLNEAPPKAKSQYIVIIVRCPPFSA